MWTFDRKGWSKIIRISRLCFSAQLLRSSFRLVNLKSFPHQTLFWQPRPPSPRPKLSSFCFFPWSEGNWNWSGIYPPHTKAQSQICCNWKTFGNISSIDFDILPFGTSLEFWLARKKSDLKNVGYLSISPAFPFTFPRLNIQFTEICFGRICIRSDLQMSLFAFGLSFRLINLEINLVHDQMESTRT